MSRKIGKNIPKTYLGLEMFNIYIKIYTSVTLDAGGDRYELISHEFVKQSDAGICYAAVGDF
jgi:hypothetical protein